jgi:hypothetical protein
LTLEDTDRCENMTEWIVSLTRLRIDKICVQNMRDMY